MSEHFPKITASSVEKFEEVKKKLETLPHSILVQIERADGECLIGIECILKDNFEISPTIRLPYNVNQIKHFDKYIGIYTDEFFFIFKSASAKRVDFIFIKED